MQQGSFKEPRDLHKSQEKRRQAASLLDRLGGSVHPTVQSLPGHRACLPIRPHAQEKRMDVYSLTRLLASGTLATLCLPEAWQCRHP